MLGYCLANVKHTFVNYPVVAVEVGAGNDYEMMA